MKYKFHKAVVIGSGTMGAAVAAHLANAGVPVTLLDIVPNKLLPEEEQKGLTLQDKVVRNRIVQQGLDRAIKSRPASFFTSEMPALVSIGNLEDDLEVIKSADWVIEAIVENLKIKQDLMKRIDAIRPENTIISTNTSGIPVTSIAEGLSDGFKQHFLGTHFFNPPRYLKLLEVIPTKDTLPAVVEAISEFGEYRLGKGIVLCKDTPNFIANRLGFGGGAFALDYILENGYTVDEVDAITGPAMGRPKTATFRLIDLVGIDVWEHVGNNLAPAIPNDTHALKYLNSVPVNTMIHTMVEKGWLGNKVKQGFYKEVRTPEGNREFWSMNLKTMDYEAPKKVRFESIGKVKDSEDLGEKLKILISAEDRAGQLVRALTYQGLSYASELVPEIADTPKPLDDAMRWGFGHDAGPFEVWDMLGVVETLPAMKQAGFPAADWVGKMTSSGFNTFYKYEGGIKVGVYNPVLGKYEIIKRPASLVLLKEQKVIDKNPGATLFDLGDGVACVEFHTKMNALDEDIANMIVAGQERLERDFVGMVIGNEADNFSAGANIMLVVMAAQMGEWEKLNSIVKGLQDLNMKARYSPKPVIVAPAGLALGGGAEVTTHGSRVVAAAELYTGFVEFGVGVIPAGGGTKEMLRRIVNPAMKTDGAEVLPFLQRVFQQIGLAKVATSAEEARQMGILGPNDRVVMNKELLLAEAKKEVLHMVATGYHPPLPEKIYAAGRDALGALRVAIHMMKEGKYITEYEAHMAGKLAIVMTGGDISKPTWVDEQYILDLEREAFMSLCGEEKTRQRMINMLQTGKPLRN
ncbi:MAG: 3-hydroxyacyl-CoA dehydrogenase [Anaerolineales bacterium]|nr:3-hydroxyacyl-CoA dehydrogenase/enoyl-CoA hydratase family protein [Anaerolineae bacterium]PWB50864.1 MAG: 3-hydroxyacyl-CoA dehydrogenase [Anaerolineales bacterium]